MKIYIIGICDCEGSRNEYTCVTKELALKRWNEIRLRLIKENNELWKDCESKELGEEINKNLSETDPTKLNNYPQEQPFIQEIELELC